MAATESEPVFDDEGGVRIPSLFMPQSGHLSPEMHEAYRANVRHWQAADFTRMPSIDAPIGEWERFRAEYDRGVVPSLERNLRDYPAVIEDGEIGGVPVAVIDPADGVTERNRNRVLINLHGGGFLIGGGGIQGKCESVGLAHLSGCRVISVDYRQAPECRFPAASEDLEAVYVSLLERYAPQAIGIYGCSAGGILTQQSVPWLRSRGIPVPGAIASVSWGCTRPGEMGESGFWGLSAIPDSTSRMLAAATATLDRNMLALGYLANVTTEEPLAYPNAFDEVLATFPPTLFITGTRTLDASSSVVGNARLNELGVDSTLYLMEGGWHGSIFGLAGGTPEGRAGLRYMAKWFDDKLSS